MSTSGEDFVEVTVSSSINDFVTIRRFPKDTSFYALKVSSNFQ